MKRYFIVYVLIPVFALTYRFLTKPFRQDRKRLQEAGGKSVEALRDARLDNMERQLEQLEASVERLVEVTEFDRQLKAGKPPEEGG